MTENNFHMVEKNNNIPELMMVKTLLLIAIVSVAAATNSTAENPNAEKPHKAPRSSIIVHPGLPIKPTQPAKPVGKQKSDWGESEKANK